MIKWTIYLSALLILSAGIITLLSLIKSSSILVKLVATEVITNLIMASIALWALLHNQPIFIDACLALALIMFLGVVAYYQLLLAREDGDVDLH